ncbi:UDP-N-acetylglucosamine 4,6-dehydratase (inverting) [Thermovibrio guaymasensis]|uniref:UDP-N-acetylglucosamine 4,6-dehydratase (Inverting) n=1 Tax=Thermovibrio guaymasensis TaxID=240167 RepID=A0A420W9Q6_9BACT|nr:UDP-N-acetylglucosamine 4,6-dehydratase (inverting) [Thermovibrio guaymasensis]RKQ64037.1 UDP-N-acetylglucosamine 4,6-dehydratase (inverting) [Thermovibrio guaymasensis]
MSIDNKVILITGGTGSFGKAFAKKILEDFNPKKVIIYSRDEYKQYWMQQEFKKHIEKLRFFIGDVRDKERLYRAFDGVDIVIHAAALKHVPLMEYNPIEAVKTNIYGAENVINAAIDRGVEKVVALSTDKAVNPINLYGATKLVADKLFIAANAYAGGKKTSFSIVRYGNVAGSRGSVIPFFMSLVNKGKKELPITDFRMTRFWITLEEGVALVLRALKDSLGGEIFVAKIPSFRIVDLAKAICPDCKLVKVGIRPGEKLHEIMITEEDARTTYDFGDYYVIYPSINWKKKSGAFTKGAKKVPEGFKYSSDRNEKWLSIEELKEKLELLKRNIKF